MNAVRKKKINKIVTATVGNNNFRQFIVTNIDVRDFFCVRMNCKFVTQSPAAFRYTIHIGSYRFFLLSRETRF